jgi:hypothetical protein
MLAELCPISAISSKPNQEVKNTKANVPPGQPENWIEKNNSYVSEH